MLVEAMNATERALGPNHLMTRTSLANVAFLYADQGRNAEAEALYLRAIESAESASGRDHPDTLTYLSMLARLYQRTGRHSEADPLLQRVYEVRLRTLGPAHASTIGALNNLATAAAVAGRVDEAAAMTERALAAAEAELGPEHPSTLSLTSNLAYLYERIGRRAEAIPLLRRALDTRERVLGRDHPDTLLSATNFGIGLIEQGRPAEGEAYLVRVLEAHERTSGPDHPDTADAAANLAAMRLYRPEVGRSALAPARRVAEIVRASRRAGASVRGGEAEEDRVGLARADDLSLLADAAWVAAETGEIARPPALALAFPALQESMPGQADRAVARMAVRRYADETRSGLGALVRERDDLADRWAASRADLSAALAGDGPEAEELRARLRDERSRIDARLTEIDSILARDFPQYAALARPEPLDLAAAQAMLAPDEAMIVVVPTLFGTQIVALSRDGSSWARSAWKRGEIDSAVRRLLWDVGGNVQVDPALSAEWTAQGGAGYPFDRTTAFNLYREIVAPVAATLAGKRHVFIAAAGSLSSLPFGMLVAAPPEGPDGDPAALRSTRWFADAHALIQIPSVQSLQFLRRFARSGAEGSAGAFVGFGDPALLGQAQARGRNRGATLTNLRQIRYMSRLPGTAVELEAMRAALGAPPQSVFLAERATESALRSADLSGTRILALATHGLMAGEISGAAEPGLVFTPPEQPSEADDGLLTASEVAALRLDADWVILSACNTAAGDGSEGAPGLSGLARAFFYAGARNLLASHWPVRDDVSARLTVRTLELQREQPALSRAEAFQRAMREIREDSSHDSEDDTWAHPNAWAPFTLIGDGAR